MAKASMCVKDKSNSKNDLGQTLYWLRPILGGTRRNDAYPDRWFFVFLSDLGM